MRDRFVDPRTRAGDVQFMVLASVVWGFSLAVAAWDFFSLQSGVYRIGALAAVGISSTSGGVAIRIVARRTLGRHFTHRLGIVRGHRLIRHGIYARVRHPAYLGAILFDLGTPLLFLSLDGFLVALL